MAGLKEAALREGRSVADLVREGVQTVLHGRASAGSGPRERAAAISGRFRSGLGDLAKRHDEHLAEAVSE